MTDHVVGAGQTGGRVEHEYAGAVVFRRVDQRSVPA